MNEVAQNNCSAWFCLICGVKAMCGKEASLLTAFLVTFVATKVTGPPAAKSGYTTYIYALYTTRLPRFTRNDMVLIIRSLL